MARCAVGLIVVSALALLPSLTSAQSNPRYIQFKPSEVKGALYLPDAGPAPKIAFLVVHRTSNFLSHISTRELSKRGYMVLGLNPRSDNNEALVNFEQMALDVKQGVEFLRKQPGIEKVILIGHSGGGPTTTFYQAVAEKGPSYCKGVHKLTECDDSLAGLPKADALVLLDAHPGNTVNTLRGLNAAIKDESKPFEVDPSLDPFDPRNGFNPTGHSVYSKEYMDSYFKAQAERMNRLIAIATKLRDDMKAGKHQPSDDDKFVIYRDRARLSDFSMGVAGATEKPQKHLKNNGSVVTEIVKSVRPALVQNAKADKSFRNGSLALTVKSFLSNNAIKATHSQEGIDWCSSNNSTPCAVGSISVPMLIAAMSGHYFIRDGEVIHDAAASADKEYIIVEGATHGMTPCTACEKATGQSYSNVTKNLFDHVAKWTKARFENGKI